MTRWLDQASGFATLDERTRARLEHLTPMHAKTGDILFRAGDDAQGYVVVLSGAIDVTLASASGREIVLYTVTPGQSCVQSTMSLLNAMPYSAEAKATCATELVLIPRGIFIDLMNQSESFRTLIFAAFGDRIGSMMHLLEKIAFQKAEARIADAILELADRQSTTDISVTQSDLASRACTAREVVSRRLEIWAEKGAITTSRGTITIHDRPYLLSLSASLS